MVCMYKSVGELSLNIYYGRGDGDEDGEVEEG